MSEIIKNSFKEKSELVRFERHSGGYPMHRHDSFIECEMVIKGKIRHNINGRIYEMESGSVYILRPQDRHAVELIDETEIINIYFAANFISNDILSRLISCSKTVTYSFTGHEADAMYNLLEEMYREYEAHESFFENVIKCGIETVILKILRKLGEGERAEKDDGTVEMALVYLKTLFRENPTLEETAEKVHMHPNYFSVRFKEYTGKNYKQYLTELKIEYAKKLLRETNMSIIQVGDSAGFGSESNFMRTFKRVCGITAREWRELPYRK